MFKDPMDDGSDPAPQQAGRAAMPNQSRRAIMGESAPTMRRISRSRDMADRYDEWRTRISARLAALDLAPDLGRDIGSRRWLRGAGTLILLAGAALVAWPDFSSLDAASAMPLQAAERDEFRSHMIMPLALGADSGRRMAPTAAVMPLAHAPERPRLDLEATLAAGDSFTRMLLRAGVGEAEAQRIETMIAGVMDPADIAAGTRVDITLGRRAGPDMPRPLDALSFRARFDLQLAVERQDGRLALAPRPITVDTTPLRVRGMVADSLYRSARAAGAPANSVQQYLRALGAELDLNRDIGGGDEFDLVVEYKRAATGEVEAGRLLYAGLSRNGKPVKQLMRWGNDGQFYEASGVAELREGLIAPVSGSRTSSYGMRRHPILGYRRMHAGIDFRAPTGTPIHAASDGRVQMAGRNGGYGNYVRLSHAGGLGTGYAHMSRIAVRAGQNVKRGQVIGYAGSTGLSTGPHLHYEMYRGGKTIDPTSVKFVTRTQLSGRDLANFRARMAELQKVAPGAALASLTPDVVEAEEPQREIDRIEAREKI